METTNSKNHLPHMLTTEQAAQYLGLAKKTLEGMRWKRNGPKYVKLNRSIRYRIVDLDKYIEARIHE